jgi:hypothetical protein
MKLNRKKLNIILPQIKAHLNVAVMMDNPEHPGGIDFIFQPKARDTEFGYLNRLFCNMNTEDDIFGNASLETLGTPVIISIPRLRDALKVENTEPEIKDGFVGGINVAVSPDDLKGFRHGNLIRSGWDDILKFQKAGFPAGFEFVMPRVDYELMAETVSRFVSLDITRLMMTGFDIDFGTFNKSENTINFTATEGRKLALCQFPCKYSKPDAEKDPKCDFILKPICLFIPSSDYSKTQWAVSEAKLDP